MSKILPIKLAVVAVLVLACLAAALPAVAEQEPSSDLLLPYFEVDLSGSGRTTNFALGNASDQPVDVIARVATNWGISILAEPVTLQAGEVRTVNLSDWLLEGDLPSGQLTDAELAHVQAALTGQPSPKDDMFYSTQADPSNSRLAVGYATFRVQSSPRTDSLWGDYFWVDPSQDYAEGELLVDIDRTSQCRGLCTAHRLRFLDGGAFDGGTKIVVWSPRQLTPAPNAQADVARTLVTLSAFHRESGAEIGERSLDLLPAQEIDVKDLHLGEPFGWLDLGSDEPVWVGVRYSANHRFSVTMQTWCLPEPPGPKPPEGPVDPGSIDVEKSTNGEDADTGPGPEVATGGAVTWEYVVTNDGIDALTDVAVTDDQEGAVDCPKTGLEPGESMTCTKTGVASSEPDFQYGNTATAVGRTPDGNQVQDTDPSHYHTPGVLPPPPPPPPSVLYTVDIEKATNGHDADAAPGVDLQVGDAVTWSYVVTNTTPAGADVQDLSDIVVIDDKEGAVTCPKTTLAVGESMTCTAKHGTAVAGQYENTATVTGHPADSSEVVGDSDPSHYYASEPPPPPPPPPSGDQGCTPGYWKNHTDSWPPTGYSPAQSVESVFSAAAAYPAYGTPSLLQGLSFQGGSGVEGGVGNLLRAAVAALLNTAHSGVDYPRTTVGVISDVDAALASGNRDTMLSLASALDGDNNLGCPLN